MEYLEKSYDYEGRFSSYWYQIQAIWNVVERGDSILEIGPGNNFLKDYLSRRGILVETLDITAETEPTYSGSVASIPCSNEKFTCVCAFEVLEHQPFELLISSLAEMSRVSKNVVLFSVPDIRWCLSYDLNIGSSNHRFRKSFSVPRLIQRPLPQARSPEDHYWEIGRRNFSVARILSEIAKTETMKCERHYRIPSNPIHHMFVLAKK